MNQKNKLLRAFVAIAMMLIGWLPSLAHDFEVDGLYYNIISELDKTIAVTYIDNGYTIYYSGDIIIPEKVDYNSETYEVVEISNQAFFYCENLMSITIPNTVVKIGDSAFYGCISLEEIIIPNSVQVIGNNAFENCKSLRYVEIGNGLSSIGERAFYQIYGIEEIVYNAYNCTLGEDCFVASEILTFGPDVKFMPLFPYLQLNVVNFNAINCKPIDDVDYYSFQYGFYKVKEINIGTDVEFISEKFFQTGSDLIKVNYCAKNCDVDGPIISVSYGMQGPDLIVNENVEKLSAGVFNTNFDKIYFNAISCAADGPPFSMYDSLNIIWGENVKRIPDYMYDGNQFVTSIKIPNSIESIGTCAFNRCKQLQKVTLPINLKSIGSYVFSSCDNLQIMYLNSKSISFGERPFEDNLKYIIIGNDVENFKYPLNRNSINAIVSLKSQPPTCVSYESVENMPILYVPKGSYATYWSTPGWQDFNKIIEIESMAQSVLLPEKIDIALNTEYKLEVSITPQNATISNLYWESSDLSVATVDQDGTITTHKEGIVTITVSTIDGSNLKSSCIVSVGVKQVDSIELNLTELTLNKNNIHNLSCIILPLDATNSTVSWRSEDRNVAVVRVNADGSATVLGVNPGETDIVVTTNDGTNLSAYCRVKVVQLAESIALDKSEINLEAKETDTLVATIFPELATEKSVEWSSSDESIATVDANGVVTAIAVGETTITATTVDGSNLSATCKVTVIPTLATSITIDKSEISLEAKETDTLVATIFPELATEKSVEWSSSDESIATVDANGLVTAIAVGETTITATTVDGSNLSATCKVTVIPTLATSITLDKSEINLEAKETTTLVAIVLPELTTDKSVEWSSSDESIAIVDENGIVTAIAVGEATITATIVDGTNLSATCKVSVIPTLATSITLDKTEISLEAKETDTLVATVLPELATEKSVEWSSSDESIAIVDENGIVTAIAVGEATITATTVDGSNLSATCKVTVVPTLAETITLDKTEISLEATETATLIVTVLPELTTDKSVEWSSSNEAVAVVDENGVVTAVAVGEATITATTVDDSNLSASCKVTVVPTLAVYIELDQTEASVEEKSDLQLMATILPEHTTNKEVAWSSSDKWVASVDNNGFVTVYAAGEAIITATTTDGTNLSATCRINVYSGIDGVNGHDVIVVTVGDNIVVKNAKLDSNVRVYAADGAMIASEVATDGDVVVEMPIKGIYIVSVNGKNFKVMVK